MYKPSSPQSFGPAPHVTTCAKKCTHLAGEKQQATYLVAGGYAGGRAGMRSRERLAKQSGQDGGRLADGPMMRCPRKGTVQGSLKGQILSILRGRFCVAKSCASFGSTYLAGAARGPNEVCPTSSPDREGYQPLSRLPSFTINSEGPHSSRASGTLG